MDAVHSGAKARLAAFRRSQCDNFSKEYGYLCHSEVPSQSCFESRECRMQLPHSRCDVDPGRVVGARAPGVERYLRTGLTDLHFTAWPGGFLERAQRAHYDLRNALVREMRRLAADRTPRSLPEADTIALTRRKVDPMDRSLFPGVEQDAVLAMLQKSVVFLTSEAIEQRTRPADDVLKELEGGRVSCSAAVASWLR